MDVVTSGTMIPETSATAEGDLGRTPFAHLMVYALDRCLTGALFLTEATGTTHAVRLERGVPVKVRPGDDHALLGAILVERGAVTEEALARALASKGRLGDVLLLADDVEPDALATALDEQFMRRMVRLYALGPDTVYRYYDGHVELADWGEAAEVDPLAQLWAGLREHADASTKLEATLERLGATPLAVRADATLDRFGFAGPDGEAVELVRANAIALPDLCAYDAASPELLRRLVYALVITRQLDLGGGAPVSDSTEAAAAEAPADEPAPKAPIGVARVALKRVKRAVAAAPDLPGDGERAAISPRASRRRDASSSPDSGPVSERRLEDEGAPVSGRLGEGERPPASGRRTEDGRSPSSGRRTEDEGPSPSRADAADPAPRARPARAGPPPGPGVAAAGAAPARGGGAPGARPPTPRGGRARGGGPRAARGPPPETRELGAPSRRRDRSGRRRAAERGGPRGSPERRPRRLRRARERPAHRRRSPPPGGRAPPRRRGEAADEGRGGRP